MSGVRIAVGSRYVLVFLLFVVGCARVQDYSAFHPVRSIDPGDGDYSDLAFLKEVIGDSRVVLLGEQSHGEGAVFTAKTRLIRYLHEEMDFNILVFESGMFECALLWDSLRVFTGDADPLLTAQKAVFGIWTRSKELRDIFRYLITEAATETPLLLRGMDSQFTGEYSEKSLIPELRRICRKHDIRYLDTTSGSVFEHVLQRLTESFDYKPITRKSEAFYSELDHLEASFSAKEQALDERNRIMRQTLRGARVLALEQFGNPDVNSRDAQMAKNLQFLCDLYPDQKLIVWAASSHIMHDNTSVSDEAYSEFLPMGTLFRRDSGIRSTTVGFTSYGGETYDHYRQAPVQLAAPPASSLERIAHDYGQPYSIIVFRDWPDKDSPISGRPFGNVDMVGYWWRCFDLMFFIDQCSAKTVIYERRSEPE